MYWIWLSRMHYMYFEVFELLISKYKRIESLWNISENELRQCKFLSNQIINDITNINYKKDLERYAFYMEKHDIKIMNCFDKSYPIKFNFIKNPPIVLFYRGNMDGINDESVAIVGSRLCTEYGRKSAKYFSLELAKRGINIVSGLALGIDSIAHCEAITAGTKTIAIVGNGLDSVYPKENRELAKRILDNNGAIISEFVIGTKPDKSNFPRRNRLISGLSNAVIVVEASEKSGSLITANYAINQGKEVWVVPGSIFSKNSEGCNKLIKDGANMLTDINDIIR